MIIEIIAIETSGLDREKDIILEAAYGRLSPEGFTGQVFSIDPGDFELSDEIIEYHTKTGLIEALLHDRTELREVARLLGPANLRVVWAKDFAAPFLQRSTLASALTGSIDGGAVRALAKFHPGVPQYDPVRAGDKVLLLKKCLEKLCP